MKNYSSILAVVNHRNWLDDSPPLRVSIGEHIIPEKNSAKYPGITFDHELKCSLHIDDVIKKFANAARILCKIRLYVSKQTLVNLYYSFAYSHLKYGILA